MKIELPNLHIKDGQPVHFDSDIYIDGKKAGSVTYIEGEDVSINPLNKEGEWLIEAADHYCQTLPLLEIESKGSSRHIEMNLKNYIHNLVAEHLSARLFAKSVKKDTPSAIIWGNRTAYLKFKLRMPIAKIMKDASLRGELKDIILKKVLPKMGQGDKILNTNFSDEFVKELGIHPSRLTTSETTINMNQLKTRSRLDNLVNDCMGIKAIARFRRRIKKEMANSIVFGIPDKEYQVWELKYPLEQLFNGPESLQALKTCIDQWILPYLGPKEKILNTNIPEKALAFLKIPPEKIVDNSKASDRKRIDKTQEIKKGRKRKI